MKFKSLLLIIILSLMLGIGVQAQDMMYGEAPMLAERVAAGELPPVEERLPANPKEIPVVESIGEYGGILRIGDILERMDEGLRIRHTGLFRYNFTASETQPDLAESFEWSNENRTLTITLREGLKWSDGDPFDTVDFQWYWDNVLNNAEVSPNGPGGFWMLGGEPATMEVIDETTFSYTWAIPNPSAMDRFGRTHFSSDNVLFVPSHYVEQFHADFNPDAQAMAEEAGFETWVDLMNARRCQCYQLVSVQLDRPYMDSFIPVEITSDRVLMERNPYFHQVDPEGNQLPYIDQIEVSLVGDQDLYALKLTAGDYDFGVRYTRPSDLQLYRQEEENGGYTTYIAQSLRPSEFSIFLNQNTTDGVRQELFQNVDFRSALSTAINRDRMNDILFFGLGETHPPTPLKTLPWFRDEWYNEHLEYNPDRTNEILDGLGLTERDSDDFRLMSNGERLTIIAQHLDIHTDGCALIANDLREVGVEFVCQESSFELVNELREANEAMATVWHIGRATLFGRGTPDDFAINEPGSHKWGSQWALWISSGGEAGIEPPDHIKELNAKWEEFAQWPSNSPEAAEVGGEYFSFFAEQLPVIPSVGLGPQPVVYANSLQNVPTEDIFWGSDTNFYAPFHVEQWYFAE